MILLDVEGVLCSSYTIYSSSTEMKLFNIQDDFGIIMAKKAGLLLGAISESNSEIISQKLSTLGFNEIILGHTQKLLQYEKIKKKYKLQDNNIAYIGDDILDIPILRKAGYPCAVKNSIREVKQIAKYISNKNGGDGAVREIIDHILKKKGTKKNIEQDITMGYALRYFTSTQFMIRLFQIYPI